MSIVGSIVFLGMLAVIGLILKGWYDDVALDHAFRNLYVETRTKLPASQFFGLLQEMETFDELERVAILQGMAPMTAARHKKRAAVKSMVAHLQLNILMPG